MLFCNTLSKTTPRKSKQVAQRKISLRSSWLPFYRPCSFASPVSYTHLLIVVDIQHLSLKADAAVLQRAQTVAEVGVHRAGIDPVSYTHLDVYKRQMENSKKPVQPSIAR